MKAKVTKLDSERYEAGTLWCKGDTIYLLCGVSGGHVAIALNGDSAANVTWNGICKDPYSAMCGLTIFHGKIELSN